ncbi:glycerophosphodiester phosphodiesterase [Aeromicrobium sp. CTD01-1L150]|uniref:glycerophosphodiester phosphodiesterase n=1 Tax=Aeromicrobium sp. CTD01-1L150 TaxID=3341830 RepID=UPI0035C12A9B
MRTLTLGVTLIALMASPAMASATPTVDAHRQTVKKSGQTTLKNPFKKPTRTISVIAHRGASGHRPEHTLAAYQLAIEQGADVIEPDLVSTKDGVLVARHENEISGTTDVADRPEFADRRTTKNIDGTDVTGWFTEDLTLAELRTLRAVERLPELRPGNTLYDGQFQVPTFDEVLALARSASERTGRTIGVAPETKHPTYFESIDLDLTPPLLRSLRHIGWDHGRAPVLVQSFETSNLRELSRQSRVPLLQLTAATGAPYDLVEQGDDTTYADLMSPRGLRDVARYADWIGPEKNSIIPRDAEGRLSEPSSVVRDAHRAGLGVSTYTVRNENEFLPTELRSSDDPAEHGDVEAELFAFFDAGIDAVFADFPDTAVTARTEYLRR